MGRPPFRGESEYLTFQQILNFPATHALAYPPSLSAPARDLVEARRGRARVCLGRACHCACRRPVATAPLCPQALLKPEPQERLGAGPDDSPLSYAALRVRGGGVWHCGWLIRVTWRQAHPFFEGVHFETIFASSAPYR